MSVRVKVISVVALGGVLFGGLFVVNSVHVHVEKQHVEQQKTDETAQTRKGLQTLFSGKAPKSGANL